MDDVELPDWLKELPLASGEKFWEQIPPGDLGRTLDWAHDPRHPERLAAIRGGGLGAGNDE